jgi:prepilin-type N-terminal cleavage/methylation domain-containing protein
MRRKGFSLIELMIVVAIIGILVAALLPELGSMIEKSKISSAQQSMKAIKDAIVRFNANEPRECQDLKWLVPKYLPKLQNDPWGTPFSLLPEDGVIISYGKDRKANAHNRMAPENRDNIEVYYKPKLAILEFRQTLDLDGNNRLNNGDRFTIIFTKPAVTTGAVSPSDFIFTDVYDIPSSNNQERWLYNNSPTNANPTTNLFFTDFTLNPPYVNDLDGGNDASITNVQYIDPATGNIGSRTLTGDPNYDTMVTFEINATDDWECVHDLYVRFANASVNPANGKYRDRRGVIAIQNGYNVQLQVGF